MFLIAVISCKKENGGPSKVPLIKRWEHYTPFIGQIAYTYNYDGQGRAKGLMVYSNYAEFLYNDDRIILNYYYPGGTLAYRETMELDNSGYITQKHHNLSNDYTYFKVSADGYLESEVNRDASGDLLETKYYYNGDGLLDSTRQFESNILRSVTIYTEYDLQRDYTIGFENIGRPFMGRKFIHPPLKYRQYNVQLQATANFTHKYTYDGEGRIIQDERVTTNNDNYTDNYEYY